MEREEAERGDPDLEFAYECAAYIEDREAARKQAPSTNPDRDTLAAALDAAVTARLAIPRDTPEWDAAQAVVERAHATLLAYDKGAGTGGNPTITIAVSADDPCADVRARLQKAVILISEASDALGWLQSFYNDVSNTAPEYFERCGDLNAVTYLMNEAAAIRERLDTVRRTGRI